MARPSPSAMFDPEVVDELRRQFKAADADGDGEIDATEACRLFASSCAPEASEEEQRRTAESLRQQLDSDKSGKISFDEYCFRFGRKYQMELNRRRRAGTPAAGAPKPVEQPAAPAGSGEGGGCGNSNNPSSLEAEGETLRQERAALELEKERAALRREREALEREKSRMKAEAERQEASPTSQPLSSGSKVVLHGLTGAAHLNGEVATVLRHEAASGRYVVDLANGSGQKSLRADNLRLQGGAAAGGRTPTPGGGSSSSSGSGGGAASEGPGLAQKAKVCLQNGLARIQIWLAGYEWWQLALGGALIVLFIATYVQLGSRYPRSGGGGGRSPSPRSSSGGFSEPPRRASTESFRDSPSDASYDDFGSGSYEDEARYGREQQRQQHRARQHQRRHHGGGYDDFDGGYDDYGGGGGGGLLGMLSGGSALQWYLIVGAIAFACWKGIIPVHQMSWFQLYMLWNFLEPLLMGGGRRRRRGMGMGGMFF